MLNNVKVHILDCLYKNKITKVLVFHPSIQRIEYLFKHFTDDSYWIKEEKELYEENIGFIAPSQDFFTSFEGGSFLAFNYNSPTLTGRHFDSIFVPSDLDAQTYIKLIHPLLGENGSLYYYKDR